MAGTDITFSGNGRSCSGYVADGSGGKLAPGVLVLHEGNGLGPHTRGKTELLAAMGYVAFAVDLFDKPATCQKVWNRLLSGVVMDALEEKGSTETAQSSDVSGLLAKIRESNWIPAPAVGEGQEFRSASIPETQGSALVFNEVVLHGSVVAAS